MPDQNENPASPLRLFIDKYFSAQLDLRVRLFNILASFGVLVSLLSVAASFFLGDPPAEYVTYLFFGLISLALIVYSAKTGRYQRCYLITVVLVFMIGFPIFFFSGGGYYGAIPYFFIFAVLFTIFMLEGKKAIVVSVLELVLYISMCIYAWQFIPVNPEYLEADSQFYESVFGFSVVSVSIGVCMYMHFRLYNQQQRELEAANEAKSRFLANMSHEIRTPIGIMLGMNEVILRENNSEQIKAYVQSAENAGQQLLTLINNILDVSAIEKGKLEIAEERYETVELISALTIVGENLAHRQDLSFNVEMDESLPRTLTGDMPHIRQIVSNFLSNAAKYTERGGVTLSFSRRPAQDGGEITLVISVADTGIGIKAESIPHLYDAFTRGDMQGQYIEGSGLGLAIAKEYAERMGGCVYVESKVGHGSVFTIEVKQKVSDSAPIGEWQLPRAALRFDTGGSGLTAPGCDILIVDDNGENLQLIKSLLARTLMRTDTATSGEECLDMAAKRRYDVILMDYMMPGMDGEETLCRLKGLPGFDTPVIALTANVVSGVREKLLNAGFCHYLSKPVRWTDLETALFDVLPKERATIDAAVSPEQIPAETKDGLARELLACGVILEDGLRYVGGDIAQYNRSAHIFTQSYIVAAGAIRELAEVNDWAGMKFRVHSLKSNARNIGANSLSETAAKLERLCTSGDSAYIAATLPVLYLEWQRAKDGLAAFSETLNGILPAQEGETHPSLELDVLLQMLKFNRYQNAMDALAALIETDCVAERVEKLREIRQKTDELKFREAERLLVALMEADGNGD